MYGFNLIHNFNSNIGFFLIINVFLKFYGYFLKLKFLNTNSMLPNKPGNKLFAQKIYL